MSISKTRARPYAKAIFDLAVEQDQVLLWQDTLKELADLTVEYKKRNLLDSPRFSTEEKINFFTDIIQQMPGAIGNLLKLLIARKKVSLLPAISASYRQLFLAYNGLLEVTVVVAMELDAEQKEELLEALRQRYQRDILLECRVDAQLIGGALIYIDDQVIDGSVIGMLKRLKQQLTGKIVYVKTE